MLIRISGVLVNNEISATKDFLGRVDYLTLSHEVDILDPEIHGLATVMSRVLGVAAKVVGTGYQRLELRIVHHLPVYRNHLEYRRVHTRRNVHLHGRLLPCLAHNQPMQIDTTRKLLQLTGDLGRNPIEEMDFRLVLVQSVTHNRAKYEYTQDGKALTQCFGKKSNGEVEVGK